MRSMCHIHGRERKVFLLESYVTLNILRTWLVKIPTTNPFDFCRTLTEVKRILKPGGTFAIFGHGPPRCSDERMERFVNAVS